MTIDQLREQIPNETSCRKFFEKLIWPNGRICPHCRHNKSYRLSGKTTRAGLYEYAYCKAQFTTFCRLINVTALSGSHFQVSGFAGGHVTYGE